MSNPNTLEGLTNDIAKVMKEEIPDVKKLSKISIIAIRYGSNEWDEGFAMGKEHKPLHVEAVDIPEGTGKLL